MIRPYPREFPPAPNMNRPADNLDPKQSALEPQLTPQMAEEEISRLTWAVLDGTATFAQRERLAELVSTQHEIRHK